jgi:hypothetical protein
MPTPDASQFTQLKKYSAVAGIDTQGQGQKRTVTRTTQPLPSVLHPLNFLPSFSNKYTTGTNFVPINRVTGLQAKTKVPGGHVFGDSAGAGGGGGPTYDETTVTDKDFDSNQRTFSKTITDASPFNTYVLDRQSDRYGHYFNLTGLSTAYKYTFETTAASLLADGVHTRTDEDTIIVLFNSQVKSEMTYGNVVDMNDDIDELGSLLSKLSDQTIDGDWCLVVASYGEYCVGTFTLKITRTLKPGGGGGGGTDAVMRQAIINLSDFTAGPAGTYSYDITTNFSNAGPDIQTTSTVTNSTINPLSSFIVNFKDKSYVTGRKYEFSTSLSSENSEMDIYIGKTGVSLTTTDVVSCVNNNITFDDNPPSPLTQNIVSTWISGGAGGGHEKFSVEDFQSATDFVNIVAMKYLSQDYSGYTLTVKVTDTPQ